MENGRLVSSNTGQARVIVSLIIPPFYNILGNNVDKWIDVNDPSTQQLLTRVPETSHADMLKIVDRAQEAFYEWRDSSVLRRQGVMLKSVLSSYSPAVPRATQRQFARGPGRRLTRDASPL